MILYGNAQHWAPPRLGAALAAERMGIASNAKATEAMALEVVEFKNLLPAWQQLLNGPAHCRVVTLPAHQVAVTAEVSDTCLMTALAFSSFTRRPQSALMPLRM